LLAAAAAVASVKVAVAATVIVVVREAILCLGRTYRFFKH
jgi:uncharacterized membrane protein (DUF373 family)